MAVLYGVQMNKILNSPLQSLIEVAHVGGRVRCFNERINLATQTTSDTIFCARLPKGAVPLSGVLHSTVSLGTSTIAIGIAGTVAKYRAAAVFTAVDVPTPYGIASAFGEMLTAQEDWFMTIAVASLPASGILRHVVYYTVD